MKRRIFLSIFSIFIMLAGCFTVLAGCDDNFRVLNDREKYSLELTKLLSAIKANDSSELTVVKPSGESIATQQIIFDKVDSGVDEKFLISSGDTTAIYYLINNTAYAEESLAGVVTISPFVLENYTSTTADIRSINNYFYHLNFDDKQWSLVDGAMVSDQGKRISYDANGKLTLIDDRGTITLSKAGGFTHPDNMAYTSFNEVWDKITQSDSLKLTRVSGETSSNEYIYNSDFNQHNKVTIDGSGNTSTAHVLGDKYTAILEDGIYLDNILHAKLTVFPKYYDVNVTDTRAIVASAIDRMNNTHKVTSKKFNGNKSTETIGNKRLYIEYYADKVTVVEEQTTFLGTIRERYLFELNYDSSESIMREKLANPYTQTMINIMSSDVFLMDTTSYGFTAKNVTSDSYARTQEGLDSRDPQSVGDIDVIYNIIDNNANRYTAKSIDGESIYEGVAIDVDSVYNGIDSNMAEYKKLNKFMAPYSSLDYNVSSDGSYHYARSTYNGKPVMIEVRDTSIKVYSIWNNNINDASRETIEANDWEIDPALNGKVISYLYAAGDSDDIHIPSKHTVNPIRQYINQIVGNNNITLQYNNVTYHFSRDNYVVLLTPYGSDIYFCKPHSISIFSTYHYASLDEDSGEWVLYDIDMTALDFDTQQYYVQNTIVELMTEYYEQALGKHINSDGMIEVNLEGSELPFNLKLYSNYYNGDYGSYPLANDNYILDVSSNDGTNISLRSYVDFSATIYNVTVEDGVTINKEAFHTITNAVDFASGGKNVDIIDNLRDSYMDIVITEQKTSGDIVRSYRYAENYHEVNKLIGNQVYRYDDVSRTMTSIITDSGGSAESIITDIAAIEANILRLNGTKQRVITFMADCLYNTDLSSSNSGNFTAFTTDTITGGWKTVVQAGVLSAITLNVNSRVDNNGMITIKQYKIEIKLGSNMSA